MINGVTLFVLLFISTAPFIFSMPSVYGQVSVNVTETNPCFLNYTANGIEHWQNCGMDVDYIAAVLLPFEWVTGGIFSMIVVTIIVIMTYIKYHTVIYPIAIGIIMLPTSYFLFPDVFLSYAIIMAFVGIGSLIWYIFVRQTKEY